MNNSSYVFLDNTVRNDSCLVKDWDFIVIQFCRSKLGFKIMSLKHNSWHISHSLKIDTSTLEMCCSDTISIGIVWEKCVWRQRASFRPVTPSYHFVFTGGCAAHSPECFTLISVTVCKGADWGNSVDLCCRDTGVLRRTPPGFKLLTHAFMWRKYSLRGTGQKTCTASKWTWWEFLKWRGFLTEWGYRENRKLHWQLLMVPDWQRLCKNVTCGNFTHINLSRQN